MTAIKTETHLPLLPAILSPASSNTGITRLFLQDATAHRIDFLCRANEVMWRVRLLPTFCGLEVKIQGKNFKDSKALILRVFRDNFPMESKSFVPLYPYPVDPKWCAEALKNLLKVIEYDDDGDYFICKEVADILHEGNLALITENDLRSIT